MAIKNVPSGGPRSSKSLKSGVSAKSQVRSGGPRSIKGVKSPGSANAPAPSGRSGSKPAVAPPVSANAQVSSGGRGVNNVLKSPFFVIKPRLTNFDPLAEAALKATSEEFSTRRHNADSKLPADVIDEFNEVVLKYKMSKAISTLVTQINKSRLDDTARQILSEKGILEYLVVVAVKEKGVKPDDLEGLQNAVLLSLEGGPTPDGEKESPKGFFYNSLTDKFLKQAKSGIKEGDELFKRVIENVRNANVSLTVGKAHPAISRILDRVLTEGKLPYWVDQFAKERKEIPEAKFTRAVKSAMVEYLLGLNLPIEEKDFGKKFTAGAFDEYFATAYYHATTVSTTGHDPLAVKYSKANVADWNFSVNQFDSIVDQGIIPINIKAAGALYYIYQLGEVLGMYKLADALVLRWANGMLDLTGGDAASKLYQYWKLRDERSSPEERGLLYKRVFDVGEAKMLHHMVANEAFPKLWHKLMEETTEYIRRSEENTEEKVSRAKIYEAMRNLQYNLTTHMTGMAHLQTQEMYAYLQSAQEILSHSEVVDYFGGGNSKNMWKVMESLWKEDFGESPNIAAIRTSAVEGNKVFQWVAKFDGAGSLTEDEFRLFLESAEAWILAQASVDIKIFGDETEIDEDEANEEFAEKEEDDFADWEK